MPDGTTMAIVLADGAAATGFDVVQTIALVLGAGGLLLTMIQITRESRLGAQARIADLSWLMYSTYTDPVIRAARGRVESLAHAPTCPTSAEEYKSSIADDAPWDHFDDDTTDMHTRRLLRFYNQVAILTRKRLIDKDFVFGLIGPGLDTCWPALNPAIRYYQYYYGGKSGTDLEALPRPIYNEVTSLHNEYSSWIGRQSINV